MIIEAASADDIYIGSGSAANGGLFATLLAFGDDFGRFGAQGGDDMLRIIGMTRQKIARPVLLIAQ